MIVNPKTRCFNKFLASFLKTGQTGHFLVVIPAINWLYLSGASAHIFLFCLGELLCLAEDWDTAKIVVAITVSGYIYE